MIAATKGCSVERPFLFLKKNQNAPRPSEHRPFLFCFCNRRTGPHRTKDSEGLGAFRFFFKQDAIINNILTIFRWINRRFTCVQIFLQTRYILLGWIKAFPPPSPLRAVLIINYSGILQKLYHVRVFDEYSYVLNFILRSTKSHHLYYCSFRSLQQRKAFSSSNTNPELCYKEPRR